MVTYASSIESPGNIEEKVSESRQKGEGCAGWCARAWAASFAWGADENMRVHVRGIHAKHAKHAKHGAAGTVFHISVDTFDQYKRRSSPFTRMSVCMFPLRHVFSLTHVRYQKLCLRVFAQIQQMIPAWEVYSRRAWDLRWVAKLCIFQHSR